MKPLFIRVIRAIHGSLPYVFALQPKYGLQMRPFPQDGRTERSPARVIGNVVGAVPGPL